MTVFIRQHDTCGKCHQKSSCEAFEVQTEIPGYSAQQCCNCMPKRICVHLDLYEYGQEEPTRTISTRVKITCLTRSYAGTLNDPETVGLINFEIFYVMNDETRQCFLAFESSTLGYTGADTLLIPLGGLYDDDATRRQDCTDFDWEFPVTVIAPEPYLNDAVIRVVADDMIEMPRNCGEETLCFAGEACITYEDAYGTSTLARVCFVDGRWETEFFDPILGMTILVVIEVVNWDVYLARFCEATPILKLTTILDDSRMGEQSVEAACPEMEAEWQFYGGQRIAIKKNPRWALNKFSDCGCICRCICVTLLEDALFATPPPRMMVGSACMSEIAIDGCGTLFVHGWAVTLVNSEDEYDTMDIVIWLEYDCETQRTYARTNVSEYRASIVCPDFTDNASPMSDSINWSVSPGGGAQPYLLTARCSGCVPCTLNQLIYTGCCPYSPLPVRLVAEVTSTNPDCANLLGEVGTLIWNGSQFEPEWTGFLFGVPITLTCGGTCGQEWCIDGGCGPLTLDTASCDPFQLVFCGGGGCALCLEPVTSQYCITITL